MNNPFFRRDIAKDLRRRSRNRVFRFLKRIHENWKWNKRKALQDAFSTLVEITALHTSEILAKERLKQVIDGKPELRC